MNFRNKIPFTLIVITISILLAIAVWRIQQFHLIERGWFNFVGAPAAQSQHNRSLDGYTATIQGKPIVGATGLSSLTYNTHTDTLFTIGDDTSDLFEISTSGDIIRRISFDGFHEVEGIQYVGGNRFLILEEAGNRLSLVEIDPDTKILNTFISRISLKIEYTPRNKNFEGLAYSAELDRVYVGKERNPVRIYEIDGFASGSQPVDILIRGDQERESRLFIKDLSGLEIDPITGNLLVMSHESRLVVELNESGHPISSLSLLKWQGNLEHSVPQAEGIAIGPDGAIYIMSEPNLFYVFKKGES